MRCFESPVQTLPMAASTLQMWRHAGLDPSSSSCQDHNLVMVKSLLACQTPEQINTWAVRALLFCRLVMLTCCKEWHLCHCVRVVLMES